MFPNSGYKSMRGHLLSRGFKVQGSRVREAMRRTDPEGTVVRALQLRVTHRRVYSVKQPLSLWHMGGHHKLRSGRVRKTDVLSIRPFHKF